MAKKNQYQISKDEKKAFKAQIMKSVERSAWMNIKDKIMELPSHIEVPIIAEFIDRLTRNDLGVPLNDYIKSIEDIRMAYAKNELTYEQFEKLAKKLENTSLHELGEQWSELLDIFRPCINQVATEWEAEKEKLCIPIYKQHPHMKLGAKFGTIVSPN